MVAVRGHVSWSAIGRSVAWALAAIGLASACASKTETTRDGDTRGGTTAQGGADGSNGGAGTSSGRGGAGAGVSGNAAEGGASSAEAGASGGGRAGDAGAPSGGAGTSGGSGAGDAGAGGEGVSGGGASSGGAGVGGSGSGCIPPPTPNNDPACPEAGTAPYGYVVAPCTGELECEFLVPTGDPCFQPPRLQSFLCCGWGFSQDSCPSLAPDQDARCELPIANNIECSIPGLVCAVKLFEGSLPSSFVCCNGAWGYGSAC